MAPMGFQFGLEKSDTCFKSKFRWLFKINGISASGIQSLPPSKASRPSLAFKEIEVAHINETIYYPGKPDFKPIVLVLYDLKRSNNPVFNWLRKIYNPSKGEASWDAKYVSNYKFNADLDLYDGCGNVIESWIFENAWPQSIEFGDLDMGSNEICTIDITLRYDRAFIV